jgi:hypothetical protein
MTKNTKRTAKKRQTAHGKKSAVLSVVHKTGLGVAAMALSVSMLIASPSQLKFDASMLMANAVGARAAVAPNEYNTLAQELVQREAQLGEREAQVATQNAVERSTANPSNIWTLLSIALSLTVLVLVGINFYLDSRRNRRLGGAGQFSINLRS